MFKTGNGGSMDGIPALGANLAVITNGTGTLTTSVTTATEISYVSGVTSSIQTQLNGKQASGNYITALTGDVTASGPGSVAATLATVLGTPGIFPASAAQIPSITVNAKGLITAISSVSISLPFSQVTGTLAFSNITGTVPIAQGGTGQTTKAAGFDALSPMTTIGDIIYGGASGTGTRLANGVTGQFFGPNTGAAPSWKSFTAPTLSTASPTSHTGAFSANGSGIYTTPANVLYLRYRIVGAGGGGSGSKISGTAGSGGNGSGATTFGTSLITCNPGTGGTVGAANPGGVGGTASIGAGATGRAITGGSGGGTAQSGLGGVTVYTLSGMGGMSPYFCGGGAGAYAGSPGSNAIANTGGGGGGAGAVGSPTYETGSGGGSGGYAEGVIIPTAGQVFNFSTASGGAGGTAGTSGFVGGTGADSFIEIWEYYQG